MITSALRTARRSSRLTSITALTLATACLGLLDTPTAHADDYNNTFRVGAYFVFYNASAQDLQGPFVPSPPNLNFSINNVTTAYFAYVRSVGSNLDIELALGYPPKTETLGKGPATVGSIPYNGQVLSTAQWVAPTLLFNYKFFDPTHKLRPYVGVGVNYTNFVDRKSTAAGDAVSGGPTRIDLSPSWGPAATVGLAYQLAPRWSLYASYSYSRVRTVLDADTAGLIRTTHVSFAPTTLVISAGVHF
jgi:outer membrane protein